DIRLDGGSAMVTGGSKGLGLAIATRYAASGADVAILARNADALERARAAISEKGRGRVVAIACDVSKADEIERAYATAVRDLGKVDIVVNNAGTSQRGNFEEITDEVWQADLDLKLFAAIRLTRLAWPDMKARGFGRVINVLNTGAKAPQGTTAPTSVTRAAGMALTKVLSQEGAPHNILVNALLVGLIMSDQWVRRYEAGPKDGSLEDFARGMAKDIPLGRIGTAEEFANIACFLASDQASYITGTAINVDGGRSPVV
ncbi:MAG TPA: SDR family oxidoreductase, partial [Beijerinckiaceae bacterium]|nr:SDR family oxidoreductase [Beijerinckiaceae bacterium]